MFPFVRFAKTIVKSSLAYKKGDTLDLDETSEITFLVNVGDIDAFFEMNNGRILTLFDLGRTDFAIKVGLGKKLLQKKWGLVVAGSTIQYRKRIRLFDKVTMKTRLSHIDARWFYMEQSLWVGGVPMCSALLRTGVTNIKTGKVVKTDKVLSALGYDDIALPPSEWVQAWIDADKLRPFPKTEETLPPNKPSKDDDQA